MQVSADTDLLVYAEGLDDNARRQQALTILSALSTTGKLRIPTQALGELCRVLRRKAKRNDSDCNAAVTFWSGTAEIDGTSTTAFDDALKLATAHGLDIWDAVILAVSAEAGCDVLLSENMSPGFVWGRCTVINPFAVPQHPLLALALKSP
jgi:predicted nucleic acid-binding protein